MKYLFVKHFHVLFHVTHNSNYSVDLVENSFSFKRRHFHSTETIYQLPKREIMHLQLYNLMNMLPLSELKTNNKIVSFPTRF